MDAMDPTDAPVLDKINAKAAPKYPYNGAPVLGQVMESSLIIIIVNVVPVPLLPKKNRPRYTLRPVRLPVP